MLRVSADNDFEPDESATYNAIMSKCLSNLIASSNTTWTWELNCSAFGVTDASTIAKGLEGNTSVTELDLSYATFTEAGLQEIVKMMEGNSTIITVNLAGASLSVGGMPGLRWTWALVSTIILAVVAGW